MEQILQICDKLPNNEIFIRVHMFIPNLVLESCLVIETHNELLAKLKLAPCAFNLVFKNQQ